MAHPRAGWHSAVGETEHRTRGSRRSRGGGTERGGPTPSRSGGEVPSGETVGARASRGRERRARGGARVRGGGGCHAQHRVATTREALPQAPDRDLGGMPRGGGAHDQASHGETQRKPTGGVEAHAHAPGWGVSAARQCQQSRGSVGVASGSGPAGWWLAGGAPWAGRGAPLGAPPAASAARPVRCGCRHATRRRVARRAASSGAHTQSAPAGRCGCGGGPRDAPCGAPRQVDVFPPPTVGACGLRMDRAAC